MSVLSAVPCPGLSSPPLGEDCHVAVPAYRDRWLAARKAVLPVGDLVREGVLWREGGPLLISALISLGREFLESFIPTTKNVTDKDYVKVGLLVYGYRCEEHFSLYLWKDLEPLNKMEGRKCYSLTALSFALPGDEIIAIGEEYFFIVPGDQMPF